jgi:hypothetical protein
MFAHERPALRVDHISIARNSFRIFTSVTNNHFADSGNDAGSVLTKMESNMINKLLGAAAMAAVILAVAPASAAKMGGCSGENLTKTESMIDTMADGEGKMMAQKEVAMAQTAMLDGKMGACGMHLNKAMHAGMMK